MEKYSIVDKSSCYIKIGDYIEFDNSIILQVFEIKKERHSRENGYLYKFKGKLNDITYNTYYLENSTKRCSIAIRYPVFISIKIGDYIKFDSGYITKVIDIKKGEMEDNGLVAYHFTGKVNDIICHKTYYKDDYDIYDAKCPDEDNPLLGFQNIGSSKYWIKKENNINPPLPSEKTKFLH